MLSNSALSLAAMLAVVVASPAPNIQLATSKVFLAGDSTMCNYASTSVINGTSFTPSSFPANPFTGWGQYLPYSLTLPITNDAIGGRSARSFTVENRFSAIAKDISPGDFVIIEFGHNDGGSPKTDDNGRSDCPGTGLTTTCTIDNGTIIKTFDAYISDAASMYAKLGAYVIVSSQTPDNPWESGTFSYSPSRFVTGAQLAVTEAGSKNVTFVDHGAYVADEFKKLGKDVVNAFYPKDHVHTGPKGADVVAGAFVKAILCGDGPLKAYVKNDTSTVDGSCL
jgi:rhamnogalacturonan acetylesterase